MKASILLEVQDGEIILWVNNDQIKTWRVRHTGTVGAPLKLIRLLEAAFTSANVPSEIEYGDGCEDLRDL